MRLRNPGAIQPAPPLSDHAGLLAARIGDWTGVAAFTQWRLGAPGTVGGAEFHVGEGELGHIHLDATAHILLDGGIAAALREGGLGRSPKLERRLDHPSRPIVGGHWGSVPGDGSSSR